ncbi:MAG TPA: hypothetical protein VLQ89_01175, partial [Candidatus Binatia bacterium]|nr:hypothetical protein [Candidatus Binatia bacterium]
MKRTVWFFLWLTGIALFPQSAPLRLGIYENPPMTFMQNGVPAGLIVDVIRDFTRKQRIGLEFV